MDAKTPAVTVQFMVSIDDNELGSFNSCEGLGVEVVLEQREEGGNNSFVWQLPTRIKYSNIKLTRPLCKDTLKVTAVAGQHGQRRWSPRPRTSPR